jgi:hypothetical protein
MNAWRADPLVWGHGPRIFEVFLEPTCPFSVKAFGKLEDLLDQAGEDASPSRSAFSRSLGTCTRA